MAIDLEHSSNLCMCLAWFKHLCCYRGNHRYRHLARGAKTKSRDLGKPVSGPQSIPSCSGTGQWSGDIAAKLDTSPYSSLTSYEGLGASFSAVGQSFSSSGSGYGVSDAYPDYTRGLCVYIHKGGEREREGRRGGGEGREK